MIRTNSLRAWLLAARPKTLSGALIPVMMGSALAVSDRCASWTPVLLCVLFACTMQVAANFINDLFDYLKGSDREDRLGPERACAQGWITPAAMKRGIGVALLVAATAGITLWLHVAPFMPWHGWELGLLGLLCISFAFLYTTKLSYYGLGDLLVVVFFGFVPVCGTYYVQAGTLSADACMASLVCGLVIDTLLVINNYRDREQDALSGKRTLIVRLGEPFGRYFYLSLGIAAWILCFWFVASGRITSPAYAWSISLYLLLHCLTWRKLNAIRQGRALNAILGETSRNMLLFGLLWCASVLAC